VTDTELTELFERHHRALFRYFFRMTRQREDAEDLTQDVFYRVSRRHRDYRHQGVAQESAWLFQIARRLMIDRYRQTTPRAMVEVPAETVGREGNQVVAFGLQEALDRLNALDRQVFVLRETVGLSYAEIAGVCEVTEDGVRARLFRVRNQLRDLLRGRLRRAASKRKDDASS
jgi:RNA polymerase sigma-70 factor (ECF subfamily)